MRTKLSASRLLLVIVVTLSACKPASQTAPNPTTTPLTVLRDTSTTIPQATQTLFPLPTGTALAAITPTPSQKCPALLDIDSRRLLQSGSFLFEYAGSNSEPNVWAVDPGSSGPRIVYFSGIPATGAKLSPDGTRLAWDDLLHEPKELVIYDLATRQERRLPWQEPWKVFAGWTNDDRINILVSRTEEFGVGIHAMYSVIDPATQRIEAADVTLDLPDYEFIENNPLGGYAAQDPTGTLVLYTAVGDQGTDTVLRDTSSGSEIWRRKGTGSLVGFPRAAWTGNGDRVAFVPAPASGESTRVLAIGRDGQDLVELTPVELGEDVRPLVRDLQWSPDERYLEYSLGGTASAGSGFILDTFTATTRQFCHGDDVFVYGQWISGSDLFVFRARQADNTEELRLLDVSAWKMQTLAVANVDTEFNLIGWISLISP